MNPDYGPYQQWWDDYTSHDLMLAENRRLLAENKKLRDQLEASKLRSVKDALTAANFSKNSTAAAEQFMAAMEARGWSFSA